MAFHPSSRQQAVINAAMRAPSFRKADAKSKLALFEALGVEANYSNPNFGDRDSLGALQQRAGWGSARSRLNVTDSAERFLRKAIPLSSKFGRSGELAQAVQVSAFPERYGQHHSEAESILRMVGGGSDSAQVDQLLQVAASIPPSQVKVSGGGGGSGPSSSAPKLSGSDSPVKPGAKIIGTPGVGTHTLGNWQSDNAIDIAVPVGTPVYANHSGVITRAGQLPGGGASGGGRFAGSRIQIGDEAWYGHLSKLTVKQGQKVKAGQLIGYSGAANGVAHLHFATHSGDPRRYYK
jgi:murein DD-endopeptidase MepM/ murein hydrolase activator NlpD